MASELIPAKTYRQLQHAVAREIEAGTQRMRDAYHQEVLHTYWNIGRIIHDTIDFDKAPTSRNAGIVKRLAKDFKKSEWFFYNVVKFYRLYPSVPKSGLSWTHYTLLMSVPDEKERARLERKARHDRISAKEFRIDVRLRGQGPLIGDASVADKGRAAIPVVRGKLYHYRALRDPVYRLDEGWMLVDMGFGIEREVKVAKDSSIHSGLIVRAIKEGEEYSVRISPFEKDRLYTYKAVIERVVDGDTFVARIDMGFRSWITERLRLRAIDAPELRTARGHQVSNYVKKILAGCPCVAVKTYKEEKFGRYLCDLFYKSKEEDPEVVVNEGIYLNQELLDKGMAGRY